MPCDDADRHTPSDLDALDWLQLGLDPFKEVSPSIYGGATYAQPEFCQQISSSRSCPYGSDVSADFESGPDFESSMTVCHLTFVY